MGAAAVLLVCQCVYFVSRVACFCSFPFTFCQGWFLILHSVPQIAFFIILRRHFLLSLRRLFQHVIHNPPSASVLRVLGSLHQQSWVERWGPPKMNPSTPPPLASYWLNSSCLPLFSRVGGWDLSSFQDHLWVVFPVPFPAISLQNSKLVFSAMFKYFLP